MMMLNDLSFDSSLHIVEVCAIIFWIGVSYGDIKWMKKEIQHLRDLCEVNFGIARRNHFDDVTRRTKNGEN